MYVYTQHFTRWLQARRVVFGRYRYNNPPPTRAKHEPTLEACCWFFSPESVQNEWRSCTRPSEEKSVRVTMGIYHAGGIWPRLVFIYSEGKKPCLYYTYSFGNTIFVHIGESDLVLFHQQRVQGHNWNRVFKNIFINLLPRLYIILLGPPVATLQCTPLTWQLYLHLYMSVSFRDIDPIESRGSSRGFNR